jgi:hypothetical protein
MRKDFASASKKPIPPAKGNPSVVSKVLKVAGGAGGKIITALGLARVFASPLTWIAAAGMAVTYGIGQIMGYSVKETSSGIIKGAFSVLGAIKDVGIGTWDFLKRLRLGEHLSDFGNAIVEVWNAKDGVLGFIMNGIRNSPLGILVKGMAKLGSAGVDFL